MANKKIIIIGPAHPLRGGLASFDERLAKQFQDEGNHVTIYTFSLQYPGFLFPGTTQFSSEPAPTNININVCINSINPFNWLKIGNKLKRIRPDLVVVRYWLPFMAPCLGTILRIVKKNKFTKVVCIADNILPHEKRIGDKQLTHYFLPPIDAFVTMSKKVLADLVTIEPNKLAQVVVHPLYDNFGEAISIDVARKKLGISNDKKVLLFFGFIRKYKGLDILFDAIKIIKDKHLLDNFVLLVAGEFYGDQQSYLEQINNLHLEDVIDLHTNFIPDSEVKNYLCAADVVVQPYRNATQSGVTPLAYHFEIPMIVTNVGGLPNLVPNGKVGLVTEPNAGSIAETIQAFFIKGKSCFLPGLKEEKKKFVWGNLTQAIENLSNISS